jgi:hypothetical protein
VDEIKDVKEGELIDVEPVKMATESTELPEIQGFRERTADVIGELANACRRGRYMAYIVSQEDGRLHRRTVREQFPDGDVEAACDGLRRDVMGEQPVPSRQPLPRAKIERPKPMDIMFGKPVEGDGEKDKG